MKVIPTQLDGVVVVEPTIFKDPRGYFLENYQAERYREAGITADFIQDNFSYSIHGTLRGLHFQYPCTQAKLVQVLEGEIFDVAVDIRFGSPTFGQWVGIHLDGRSKRQLYIPEGFAHGFAVMSDFAMFTYKCSDFYSPSSENGVIWNDPMLGIDWPIEAPLLSEKDQLYKVLKDIPADRLPPYRRARA